jgi:hypothetical protein
MPELLAKKAEAKAKKTNALMARDPKVVQLANLKGQEAGAMAKLERIKHWPENQREIATARTEDTLSQIRERMSVLESAK